MKKKLFGDNINHDNLALPFVLVGLLDRFENRYQAKADAFFKEMSWKQMFFLNGIELFEGTPTIKDMADFMGCSHQNANKLYARLLRDGYITSEQDETDHRKQRLYLTDKARNFFEINKEKAEEDVREIFSVVTEDEIKTVIEIMSKLTDNLCEK